MSEFPLIFESHHGPVKVGDQEVLLHMWDTHTDHDDRFREISYHKQDVFLVFFSYDSVESLENVRSFWVPEIIKTVGRPTVLMLVGIRPNVSEDYQLLEAMGDPSCDDSPVKAEMVHKVVEDVGADGFLDCCPYVNDRVQRVIEKALEIFLEKKKSKRRWWWQKK